MVIFMEGSTQLGTSALNGNAAATLSISTLAAGSHNLTAAYNGDSNFNVSTSASASLLVNAADFSISAGAMTPSSVAPGKSAQSAITISPLGGLDPATVKLTCSISPAANPAPACSVGTISVANNTGTSSLTVTTAGPQAALVPPAGGSGTLFAVGLLIPAILLTGAGMTKTSHKNLLAFCLLVLILGGSLLQVACGGSSGSGNNNTPPPSGNSGTPSGVYNITITGNATGGIQHQTAVALNVQ
jgi:hypothetical protein